MSPLFTKLHTPLLFVSSCIILINTGINSSRYVIVMVLFSIFLNPSSLVIKFLLEEVLPIG